MKKEKIIPTPPIEEEKIRLSSPKTTAAGPPSLVSAAKHIFREMNLRSCVKILSNLNQIDGIDCPGCAWPDPAGTERSALGEYCENGVKAITEEATFKRVAPSFFQQNSAAELSKWSDYQLGKSGRLTHPMILRPGNTHYEPLSWEDAFTHIASQLNALASPDEAIFYTSGRTSNEAAFLYQLFVRQFGTNNLPDCSNMCHESSGVALSETLGIGKGSVKLEDFYITDLIIVIGQNPGTNHPRMLSALQTAKRNGAKIISINPLKETGLTGFKHPQEVSSWLGKSTDLSDLFLQVRINQDVPLLKALVKLLLEAEEREGNVLDKKFIEEHTEGFAALKADSENYELEELAAQSGLTLAEIKTAAQMIISAKKMIVCWAMGLTQHKNGVQNIQEVVNLLLLKGCVGIPGAGTCPVRGHSNVQGDRTMGIWDRPKPAFLDKLAEVFDFEPPRHHGFNTVEAIEAMIENPGKVFFAMGGNFLSASPDTAYTARALQNCELTVQVSTKLNRSHLITGKTAIILPCLGRTEIDRQAGVEQFVSVENSMGIVHSSRGRIKPASEELLSEPAIVARLAVATLGERTKTDWLKLSENYDQIRDLIEKSVNGFDNYNQRVRNPGGFYLPNGARDGDFRTLNGKANFTVNPLPEIKLEDGEYLMMTIRSHDQFNTTIYGLDDRYRGIYNGRRVILMNNEDIAAARLKANDYVDLFSHYDGIERTAPHFMIVAYDIPRYCVATYFPEANPLVPVNHFADKSYTPISKSVVIRMRLSS